MALAAAQNTIVSVFPLFICVQLLLNFIYLFCPNGNAGQSSRKDGAIKSLVCRLSLAAVVGGCSHSGVEASHGGGFSRCRAWALGHAGASSWGTWTLELGLKSCGSRA